MNQQSFPLLNRREALQVGGGLVVTLVAQPLSAATHGLDSKPALKPTEMDSWISVGADGNVTAFFGKIDVGQGLDSAVAQIVAEELDVPFTRVTVVMGDTATTCNQGGASGSTGVQRGGTAMRVAGAEARRLLMLRAAEHLHVPMEQLETHDGAVRVSADPTKAVTYAQLVGGKYFHETVGWNGKFGNELGLTGPAKLKSRDSYKVVGQSPPRPDIAAKAAGRWEYVTDVKLPGMLHGRVIRPPVAGAQPISVDVHSVAKIDNVQVVHRGNYLGVVAENEWDAIRAAEALQVTWSKVAPPFPPFAELYNHIRSTPANKTQIDVDKGKVDDAFAASTHHVSAEYYWPFQSHASMGPACAIADVRPDGATCWSGSQKPYFLKQAIATLLKLPAESVRVIWKQGPGSYGRNDAGDAAADAAILSQAVGKPVRLQGMRHDGSAWDPKGPASIHQMRAAIDKDKKVVAYEAMNKGFSRIEVSPAETDPNDTLAGMLLGYPDNSKVGFGSSADVYNFENRKIGWQCLPPFIAGASPLRCSHLRDPVGPQNQFANESFIDELALATGMDPVELRLRHVTDPRHAAVIKAVAERAGWKPGPPGTRRRNDGKIATGSGMAFVLRAGTAVATIAEVEVNQTTGRIWAKRVVVAHDCGLVINPQALRLCIEANVIQGLSRAMCEEVTFDRNMVTSNDWLTYPILDIADAPESIDIVIINRPETDSSGAGEASTATMGAVIANAIFDATGVRLRQAPLTPARYKAALNT